MILTFIRHGQTVGNAEKIVNGHSEDPLNEIISDCAEWDLSVNSDCRLRERFYGAYEGQSTSVMDEDIHKAWLLHYQFVDQCEEIETLQQMIERRESRYKDNSSFVSCDHIVIVTHWSLIRIVTWYLLWMSVDEFWHLFWSVDNCGVVSLDMDKKKIIKYNA